MTSEPPGPASALVLRELTVERGGRVVVRDVSVEIPVGQVTTLLGPNGAGKSTLVLAVGGVLKPKAGSVLLGEAELTGRRPERIRQAGVAIVPEGRRLLPDLTVADNLRVAGYALSGEAAQAGRERVLELFPQLGKRLGALARTLSGGEQQMVAIGRALMARPRIMLLDEPSLGLAPLLVKEIFNLIAKINGRAVTVLMVEQNARQALRISHKAYVLEKGRVTLSGSAARLIEDPYVVEVYLGKASTEHPWENQP